LRRLSSVTEWGKTMIASKLRRTMLAMAVFAAAAAPTIAGVAANAAGPADGNKGNKGGEVRGTTRADERAGVHGDQGRDRAEENKAKAKKGTTTSSTRSNGSK
jgi:hypothetical protein